MTTDTGLGPTPLLQVRGADDLAQAVPYLLGFHPSRSLVLVGLADRRVTVTARVDLDEAAGVPDVVVHTVAALRRGGSVHFVGLVYDRDAALGGERCEPGECGSIPVLPWEQVARSTAQAVRAAGGHLDDIALIVGERWWSYSCADPSCCPPGGRLLDGSSRIAAEATYAGLVALPDRASVGAALDPDRDEASAALVPSLVAARRASIHLTGSSRARTADGSVKRALFAAARAADAAAARADDGADADDGEGDQAVDPTRSDGGAPGELSEADLVRFAVALGRVEVRDAVWLAVDEGRLDGRALWAQLARRLPAPWNAPALFLFGWVAYRRGNGALAGIAAERALAADPGYSAADLLAAALAQGVDPRRLPRLRGRGRARR